MTKKKLNVVPIRARYTYLYEYTHNIIRNPLEVRLITPYKAAVGRRRGGKKYNRTGSRYIKICGWFKDVSGSTTALPPSIIASRFVVVYCIFYTRVYNTRIYVYLHGFYLWKSVCVRASACVKSLRPLGFILLRTTISIFVKDQRKKYACRKD